MDHDEKATTLRIDSSAMSSTPVGPIYSDYSHVWEMTPRKSQQVQPSQLDLIEPTERCPIKQSGVMSSQGCLLDYHHHSTCPNNQQTYSAAPQTSVPSSLTVIDSGSAINGINTNYIVDLGNKPKCAFI